MDHDPFVKSEQNQCKVNYYNYEIRCEHQVVSKAGIFYSYSVLNKFKIEVEENRNCNSLRNKFITSISQDKYSTAPHFPLF